MTWELARCYPAATRRALCRCALPNGTDIEICTIQWAATGETDSEKPQIEDRVGGIGFREIDDQLPNHSVYFWEGTQIYEFRIDDIDGERDNYIQWSGTGNGLDRPSGVSTGATVRCIIATSGQTAVVQAYAMLQPPATGAINEVGDPGVLANLLTAQPGGLRQEHELEIRCGSGRGRVEVTIENWVTTQSILRRS